MAEPLWTSEAIAAATDGALSGPKFSATGVTFDSREVQPGDLFVALPGVRDGHDFVPQALSKGAVGAIATRAVEGSAVLVPDALRALERLGEAARDRSAARRAAVTGSVGKTSVTQAIAAALRLAGPAHSSVKSFNNHIGVPLTLARMPADTERAVFEIGMNHSGEIGPLSRMVRPHAAIVTTVGPVHTENFPDGEAGVARAKAEIFEGLEPGGVAILNCDNPWFDLLADAARARGARVQSFGSTPGADARLLDAYVAGGPLVVQADVHGRGVRFAMRQNGMHWAFNSLAVLLACEALDVPAEIGVAALSELEPLTGRGAEREINGPRGAFVLIDESYNANPISMRAALATLKARQPEGRRIVALTDMLELGGEGAAMHADLAEPAAESADLVFTAGPLMRALSDALPAARRGGWAATAAELAPMVAESIAGGDVVMVKGSNGSRASAIVEHLSRLGGARLQNAGGE